MSKGSSLSGLLASKDEPRPSFYEEALNNAIKDSEDGAFWNVDQDTFLLHLSSRSHRLTQFFHRLYTYQRDHPLCPSNGSTRLATLRLVSNVLTPLLEILKPEEVVQILVPALQQCLLTGSILSGLRNLASTIAKSDSLLGLLASHPAGSQAIYKWTAFADTAIYNPEILQLWTQKLVDLASHCISDHNVTKEVKQWNTLLNLKQALQVYHDNTLQTPVAQTKDSRRYGIAGPVGWFESSAPSLSLDRETVVLLAIYKLPIPSSMRALRHTIECLQKEKTTEILVAIAGIFPCQLCHGSLRDVSRVTIEAMTTVDESVNHVVQPAVHSELIGDMVGEWKILLSATALKSFQQKANSGRSAPIKGKLLDLASGSWVYKLAGQQNQRKQLKIHLARTKCGELAILWQIDIGVDCGVLKQLIKIWQIGTTSQISKAIDQVIALQSTYPAEIIAKCRQQPIIQAKKYIPRQFEADSPTGSQSEGGPLDIRILDQETIEMSNKFYALTEPLIRFVLANDLNAEFPLDLSRDEEEVINHFQSATLILGRSGTGKTTCLVFKLVAQYLARKKARGENPKKQVLITRSSYLADKLRVYTQRLIRTTTSNALSLEPLQGDETDLDTEAVDDGAQQTVLALTDDSFPLVCTFDQFLQLLESTVRIMDRRRNFAIQGQGTLQRRQCVDFSCFELDYWPSFDRTLTKGFPIALVFTEIMGVIKGSAKSRKTLTPLSREDYVTLSYRLAPAFVSESERSRVYQIFESYEATKLLRRGQDDVDRVIKVLKAVREDLSLEKLLRSKFDEVYIDEVQDQRIMDIEMFLSLVKDSRGFHFAGDTAQAISQESTFRFADVKALFYEYFAAVSASTNQAELAQPVMFALSKNYRSHKGILALASLVMAWLWKAFPETVDKLEPEIGQLSGPKPVLFLGCDASILVSSHVGQVELAGNRADFGAEQVILVHDETAKAYLQAKIGDAALVLTILQSKGMEFDDVVIWNFFTDCPYLAGVRSLEGLTSDEVGAFDPRKHIQMCSILKSLYVAVTRPRIQLFLIENADEELAILERVLSLKPSEPLVEVTRSHDTNFAELLGALRPGRSDDPERWEFRGDQLMRQQNYQDALFCFNRAGSSKKATIAKGRLQEKYGRTCFAEGNLEKFKGHIEAAVSFFLEAGLITEAASNLIRLERFQQAADVWAEYGHHAKAAPLYKRAGLSRKAAESFHEAGNYDEAVAALRQGGYFDEMVSYLGTNHVHISSYCYRSCSTYCKLLLKQGRIAPQYRKDAIELLGSPKEQEEYFLGYDMIEELTALYATQRRHRDLFELCVRTKRLDQALTVPFDSGTVGSIPQRQVAKVVDYLWARQYTAIFRGDRALVREVCVVHKGLMTDSITHRIRQWESLSSVQNLRASLIESTNSGLGMVDDSAIKDFMVLRAISDPNAMLALTEFDAVPLDLFKHAIRIILDLALGDAKEASSTLLLLVGVWQGESSIEGNTILPWSLIQADNVSNVDVSRYAKRWVFEKLSSAFQRLDAVGRDLYNKKWPLRCAQLLVRGYCPTVRSCSLSHEDKPVSPTDCSNQIEDLIRLNALFCTLTPLYYRRIMPEEFQTKYLAVRRHWLERLTSATTYISSLGQDASVIAAFETELLHGGHSILGAALQDLLFFKLGKDFADRAKFSWFLEQLQLSKKFGTMVQKRYARGLYIRLADSSKGVAMQGYLSLLDILGRESKSQNAQTYKANLKGFLSNLNAIDISEFSSMHAFTAKLEQLTASLILRISPLAFIIPRSWTQLCLPNLLDNIEFHRSIDWSEKHTYRECLIQLIRGIGHLLSRLDQALHADQDSQRIKFGVGKDGYHHGPLQQRNLELLIIALVHTAENPTIFPGYLQGWQSVQGVIEHRSTFSHHLRHKTIDELCQKFANSFAKYAGKNQLLLVTKDNTTQSQAFKAFRKQHNIEHILLSDFISKASSHGPIKIEATKISSAAATDEDVTYANKEEEAALKIQRRWRIIFPKILHYRELALLPFNHAVTHFLKLSNKNPCRLAIRVLLLHAVVEPYLELATLNTSVKEMQEELMSLIVDPDLAPSLYETIDPVLHSARNLESIVKVQSHNLSEEVLGQLVKQGDLKGLQELVIVVQSALTDAEKDLSDLKAQMGGLREDVQKEAGSQVLGTG